MSLIASFDEFVPQLRVFMTRAQEAPGAEPDAEFNRLAAALFALQRDAVPIYGELCRKRKVSAVADWRDIPALPTTAFKEYDVTSLPPAERTHVFHSSGTTQHRPSRHFHNAQSLAVYEESLRPWFRRHFLGPQSSHGSTGSRPAFRNNPQLIVLTPPPAEAPHSSLAHMFGTVRPEFGGALFTGRVNGEGAWALDLEQTMAALREAQSAGQPVALLGTAFSFVHLLDHCRAGQARCRLAAGSRALETGGYKGRGRAAPKGELRQMMTRWLGIPESHILGEYGMSELSSQAYDRVLPETGGGFRFPPWARAQVISPETGREAADGETGMVRVFDLANVRSALAVQTEDLAVRRGEGFELTGRAAGAAARGCSLLLEEL
jgi:predicted deacetylase